MRLPEMVADVRVEVVPDVAVSPGHGTRQVTRITGPGIRFFAVVL